MRKLKLLLAVCATMFSVGAMAEDVDYTDRIQNANLASTEGWVLGTTGGNWSGIEGSSPSYVIEAYAGWGSLEMTSYSMKQNVTLPSGKYRAEGYAFYRYGLNADTDPSKSYANFVAGDFSSPVVTLGGETLDEKLTAYPNSTTEASAAFTNGYYKSTVSFSIESEQDISFGYEGTHVLRQSWFIAGPIKLYRTGDFDYSLYIEKRTNKIAEAKALYSLTTVPAAAIAALKDVVATEEAKECNTVADYNAVCDAIDDAINAYTSLELQNAYAAWLALKDQVLALDDDATIFSGDATIDISAAETAIATATTVSEVNAACNKLRQAALAFVTTVTVKDGKYFDLTDLWIVNPTVRQNIDGWTIENLSATGGSAGVTSYEETEFYQRTFDFFQTLTLPKGTYEFGVTGFHRAGNHATYFYAGEDKILIPGVESSVVNNMADAKTYFDAGNGKVSLKFALEDVSNIMKIGIVNNDTETDKWTIFRDFTLHYFGSTIDYSIYDEQWNTLVINAGTAKTAHPNVKGGELTALDNALADAPDGSSKANYIEKINALDAAINSFNAAAPSYNAFDELNANVAEKLGVTMPTITSATVASDLMSEVEGVIVNEFNAANAYAIDYTSKLGDWENAPGTNKGESWDGTTGDGSDTYYDLYNSADRVMSQAITLPAGDYALIAKGRASANGLLTLTDGTNTITFAHKSSVGRGIATDGTATFDAGATYANSNNGRGWEYRVLTFTSDGTTPITLTFSWKTSGSNWAGLDDITLRCNNTSESVEVTAAEYATYVSDANLDFSATTIKAYKAAASGDKVVLTPINKVAAGTPVVLYAEGGKTEDIPVFDDAADDATGNELVRGTGAAVETGTDPVNYILNNKGGNIGFYKAAGQTVAKNRAYLPVAAGGGSARMNIVFGDEATGISSVLNAQGTNEIYNLQGQRVKKAQKGLFIQNGKKVIIK